MPQSTSKKVPHKQRPLPTNEQVKERARENWADKKIQERGKSTARSLIAFVVFGVITADLIVAFFYSDYGWVRITAGVFFPYPAMALIKHGVNLYNRVVNLYRVTVAKGKV